MIKLLSRFGGIWKDGAVEEPVDGCYCSDGRLVVLSKASGSLGLCRRLIDPVCWGDWWWLDCRIPKSLLPEEAFDLVKVLYPGVFRIKRGSRTWLSFGGHDRIEVDWGDRIIYPPIEPIQSVNVTLENWLMYLHWDCEYGISYEGGVGKLIGLAESGQFALLVAGGGVAFSSQVRVKVGVGGKSVLAADGDKSYSPPIEVKWIDATLENWRDYLLKRCQFLTPNGQWIGGFLVGMTPNGNWLVETDGPVIKTLAYVTAGTDKLQFLVEPGQEVAK